MVVAKKNALTAITVLLNNMEKETTDVIDQYNMALLELLVEVRNTKQILQRANETLKEVLEKKHPLKTK